MMAGLRSGRRWWRWRHPTRIDKRLSSFSENRTVSHRTGHLIHINSRINTLFLLRFIVAPKGGGNF
jgi:hypothetical protein